MSKYQPDGKCETCRNLVTAREGDGFHEPFSYVSECGVEDRLIQIRNIRQEIADELGDEDAYGEDPIEGCGVTKLCPLYLEWALCQEHGLPIPPGADYGCSKCDEQGYDELARDLAEEAKLAEEYWAKERGDR